MRKGNGTIRMVFARKGIWNVLLAMPFLLLQGCDLFGDECNDCQAAIDHMYFKAPDFNCNKDVMQETHTGQLQWRRSVA